MLFSAQDIVALTCGCPSIFSFQRSTKLENFYVLNQTLSFARAADSKRMVGLGRFELPTSPLSGVRSNQLSYRPLLSGQARLLRSHTQADFSAKARSGKAGGAGRDRTGDLLSANQALSQLSYSPSVNAGSGIHQIRLNSRLHFSSNTCVPKP